MRATESNKVHQNKGNNMAKAINADLIGCAASLESVLSIKLAWIFMHFPAH